MSNMEIEGEKKPLPWLEPTHHQDYVMCHWRGRGKGVLISSFVLPPPHGNPNLTSDIQAPAGLWALRSIITTHTIEIHQSINPQICQRSRSCNVLMSSPILQNENHLSFLIHHVCIYRSISACPTLCIHFQHILCIASALSPARMNTPNWMYHSTSATATRSVFSWPLVMSYLHAGMPHTQVGWVSIFPRKKARLSKVPNKYWPDISVESISKFPVWKSWTYVNELKIIWSLKLLLESSSIQVELKAKLKAIEWGVSTVIFSVQEEDNWE
jgi:hypothetical protein